MLRPDVEPVFLPGLGVLGPELLEIRLAVLLVAFVAPEAARHGGERVATHQLAGLTCHRDGLARVGVENVAVVAERPHLHLVNVHGARRVCRDPGACDVGAAGNGGEVDLCREGAVEPLKLLARERRASRGHEAEVREVEGRRLDAGLLELEKIPGARAPVGSLEFVADTQ